ncbi:hypothetical protein Scep_000237 [Stephania cephalantha]|uniref:J domain-containing protein n=1 Tax=Stephania cephalantha TaxID=152367 RepID=A0AAP0L671_9MAGN
MEIDHYEVLGLPSGEEGTKLSDKEIAKAYRQKALELHPDKRRDDPDADSKFQSLKFSYEVLKDEKARQVFNDLVRARTAKRRRETQFDSKRRRMVSDLEERERAAAGFDSAERMRQEEERIDKKLKEEIARYRAMYSQKKTSMGPERAGFGSESGGVSGSGVSLDKDRILKVSWSGSVEEYGVERLKEIFGAFGEVEDVVVQSKKKKKRTSDALVVMATKDAAVAAMGSVCGDMSNPLIVLPMRAAPDEVPSAPIHENKPKEAVPQKSNNPVGITFEEKERMVLEMLRKAAEKQKSGS